MTKEIKLSKGYVALVDEEDYERLSKHKWSACICGIYQGKPDVRPRRIKQVNNKKKRIYMYREILGVVDQKVMVDHRDSNPLNNTKANLRICTTSQNVVNKPYTMRKTSIYRGVSKNHLRWSACISHNNQYRYLGLFKNEIDAALAYNKAAKELHGEFAILNILS